MSNKIEVTVVRLSRATATITVEYEGEPDYPELADQARYDADLLPSDAWTSEGYDDEEIVYINGHEFVR